MSILDSMSDREKTALVAEEVMGWTVNRSERGWATVDASPKRLIGPSKCRLPGDCWDPWVRIDHAWEVVEKMQEKGYVLDLVVDVFRPGDPAGVDAVFWNDPSCHDHMLEGGVHADTAPEAICRAALDAMGGLDD